ncbi:MAG: hypothetical protein ACO4B5_12965, partial [Steroidobacteraceae bacterium]
IFGRGSNHAARNGDEVRHAENASCMHLGFRVRIPRHSATRSTNIRPVIPPTSGHPFHEHPATWEAGLRGKLSSLISGYPVKGFPG